MAEELARYAQWLTQQEVDSIEAKMPSTFLGCGFLHPQARLPVDLFLTESQQHPVIGIYRKNGQPVVTDASSAFFGWDPELITVT